MQTVEFTAPATWASAIVNIDYSGMDKPEIAKLNRWLLDNGLTFSDCLSCSDEFIGRWKGELCMMAVYTFPAKNLKPKVV